MFHGNSLYFAQVSNDEIYTAYDVQVRATNSFGKGPFSDISVAHTAELGEDFQLIFNTHSITLTMSHLGLGAVMINAVKIPIESSL